MRLPALPADLTLQSSPHLARRSLAHRSRRAKKVTEEATLLPRTAHGIGGPQHQHIMRGLPGFAFGHKLPVEVIVAQRDKGHLQRLVRLVERLNSHSFTSLETNLAE